MDPQSKGESDLTAATTIASYKCIRCGNMFSTDQESCDVCGFHCSEEYCAVIHSSNEDY